MIIILIAGLIGAVIAFMEFMDYSYDDLSNWIIVPFPMCVGFIIGGMIGFLVALIFPMDTYGREYYYKIEALQDSNNMKGNFFLGSGHIDGKMQYVFYYEEDGLYSLKQVDATLAKVKYSEESPKVFVTEIDKTESWVNLFAIDMTLGDKTYIIEVPKGTIQHNYNLDAQ